LATNWRIKPSVSGRHIFLAMCRQRPEKPEVGIQIANAVIPIEGVFLRLQMPGQIETDNRRSIIVDGKRSYGGYYDET
jgi:hypothetical protein